MPHLSSPRLRTVFIAAGLLAAAPAFAHPGAHHAAASISAGFLHPLSGLDHLLAMLAVGVWAAQQRRPARGLLAMFPLMMAAGALAALLGLPLPAVEPGIAASVLALGLLVAFAVRMPQAAGAALVSVFALFHGFAHGTELPAGASIAAYGAGFVVATVLLHLAGMGASSLLMRHAAGLVRAAGAAVALAGAYLLAFS